MMNAAAQSGRGEPAPMNAIPGALERLSSSIHTLGLVADTLAGRLSPVLLPAGAPPDNAKSDRGLTAVASNSPTAEEIRNLNARVDNIAGQLQDVLNRTEV